MKNPLFTQDSSASYDFFHYDSDPTPDRNSEEPNSHGTECAGIIGMVRNGICGVGVANRASIACESNKTTYIPLLKGLGSYFLFA